MDKSPLTQQPRPEAFQQKIVRLYQELFKVCTLFLSQNPKLALAPSFFSLLLWLRYPKLTRVLAMLTIGLTTRPPDPPSENRRPG